MKNKRLNNCFRLKENKEETPLKDTGDTGLGLGLGKTIKQRLTEQMIIFKCGLRVM